MEEFFLPTPAVAGILSASYVEARLHTDGTTNAERIKDLQDRVARSIANPIYVIVDPKTEEEVARYEGAAVTGAQKEAFIEFLADAAGG